MRMTAARTEHDENSQNDILKKLRSYNNQGSMNRKSHGKVIIGHAPQQHPDPRSEER